MIIYPYVLHAHQLKGIRARLQITVMIMLSCPRLEVKL